MKVDSPHDLKLINSNADLVIEASLIDIIGTQTSIGQVACELLGVSNRPGALGRRVRHQIHVYKILKWLKELKKKIWNCSCPGS